MFWISDLMYYDLIIIYLVIAYVYQLFLQTSHKNDYE